MSTHVQCQACGSDVTGTYARVFGDEDGDLWACPNCTSRTAIAQGAATAPDADGTPHVHKPGSTEPQPAEVQDDEKQQDDDREKVRLQEAREQATDRQQTSAKENDDEYRHDDEEFAALVAE